ncbi:tyrosine-type recombinase/integrase [Limibacter armeniacum]|uniref:tyrosine-type recombinase/integrase n=1 Tax=Limibacter armeniacum TaxID=466084 RepID=UPI002FE64D6F
MKSKKIEKMQLLFWLRKAGGASVKSIITCRITINGNRTEVSTGIKICPAYWDKLRQQVSKKLKEADQYNQQQQVMSSELLRVFTELRIKEENITARRVGMVYRKGFQKPPTLLNAYDDLIELKQKVEGLEPVSLKRYHTFKGLLQKYLSEHKLLSLGVQEMTIQEGRKMLSWYMDFQTHTSLVTARLFIGSIRAALRLAVENGYMASNPLIQLSLPKAKRKKIDALSVAELQRLEAFQPASVPLQKVRDLFLFQCYTGLSYETLARFDQQQYIFERDDIQFIRMTRSKTDRDFVVPLSLKAKVILDRWGGQLPASGHFRVKKIYCNQVYNKKLKQVAVQLGIAPDRLTSHMGRRTFATHMVNQKKISMEAVAKMLGHSDTRITQSHYAEVMLEGVIDEMRKVL